MRAGAAVRCDGIFHEASIYASDSELSQIALPFLTEGLAAKEPTYVVLGAHAESLIRRELGEREGICYLPAGDVYVKPSTTVLGYRDVASTAVESGAEQVRFITEVPHPGLGSAWDWWGRYESAVNEIFVDLPVWAVCTYDVRTTPRGVLDEVIRAHPYLALPGGEHARNAEYASPSTFLAQRAYAYIDPLEAGEPLVALTDPSLREARRAAVEVTLRPFGRETADNLALAVSEVVTNAHRYGRSPVELRLWCGSDRVVAMVRDSGTGFVDSTIGLAPVDSHRSGGRGLWIASQVCDHVGITRSPDGFTVRLVVGTPHHAS